MQQAGAFFLLFCLVCWDSIACTKTTTQQNLLKGAAPSNDFPALRCETDTLRLLLNTTEPSSNAVIEHVEADERERERVCVYVCVRAGRIPCTAIRWCRRLSTCLLSGHDLINFLSGLRPGLKVLPCPVNMTSCIGNLVEVSWKGRAKTKGCL